MPLREPSLSASASHKRRGTAPTVQDAREGLNDVRVLLSQRRKTLALTGKLEHSWPLGADDAAAPPIGVAKGWVIVHMPSGGVFRRSPAGNRVYITYDRPEPSTEVSQEPLIAVSTLMKDFVAAKTTIGLISPPSWVSSPALSSLLDTHIGPGMARRSSVLGRLLEHLHLQPAAPLTAQYWLQQRSESVVGQLAASATAVSSSSSGLPGSIVYLGVGIKDDQVKMLYVGKTSRGYTRISEQLRATVACQIAGADAAPLHYQTAARCDQVIYFPMIEAVSKEVAAAATTLAIWERLLCWMLGTFQLNPELLRARAQQGLPALCSILGGNGTACLEGPEQRGPQSAASPGSHPSRALHTFGPSSKPIGVTDELLLDLRAALAACHAHLIGQRVLAAQGGNADVTGARESVRQVRCFLSVRRKTLALAGELKYRWPLAREARIKCLGYELKTEDKAQLRAMMLDEEDEGMFCVRVRLTDPSPETDLFLGCLEQDLPLYRGMVLEVGAARTSGATDFALKVQIIHAPFSPIAQALADQVFGMLPEDEQTRRRRSARAKKAEIAARRPANFHQLSPLAQKLQIGAKTLALAGKLVYRWPLGRDARTRCLGYELKTSEKAQLRGLVPNGEHEGLFCVRVRLGASSPGSDLFVGCTEQDRPLYQGMVMEIGAAGADLFPLKVQIMHAPFSPIAEVLAGHVFDMLPDQEPVKRKEAAQVKKAEIAARRSANHHQLSSTAQALQAGTCPLNQFVCLVLDEDSRLFNWLADSRDIAAVEEISTALGFGVRQWTDHDYPQTFARLVTGGTGLYDFAHGTAARIPHLSQDEGFELRLLHFNGDWVRCPRRLVARAYKTPEAQRRNSASFDAFLNAGREMLGLPARDAGYLPPGFEASGSFDYKVCSRSDKHGNRRFNLCGGLNLIGAGTRFDFGAEDVRGVFGARPEEGPLEADLMWTSNIATCSREEDLVFEFKVDGVDEAPWYRHVWADPHNRGYGKRARCRMEHQSGMTTPSTPSCEVLTRCVEYSSSVLSRLIPVRSLPLVVVGIATTHLYVSSTMTVTLIRNRRTLLTLPRYHI